MLAGLVLIVLGVGHQGNGPDGCSVTRELGYKVMTWLITVLQGAWVIMGIELMSLMCTVLLPWDWAI